MNLMFWKKKTGAREDAENARENPAVNTKLQAPHDLAAEKQDFAEHSPESTKPETTSPETPVKPGLVARLKLRLIAMTERFRKIPAPAADEDCEADSHGRSESAPEGEDLENISDTKPVRSKKRLVIGGAISLLILLLAGIGIAIWPVFTPHEKRLGTSHDMATTTSHPLQQEPAHEAPQTTPEKPQTGAEVLVTENSEAQTRIEAPDRKPPQQQPHAPPVRQTVENAPSSSSGELMVGNKDPKASAMSLKEAIEAMNANSGNYGKKPAK